MCSMLNIVPCQLPDTKLVDEQAFMSPVQRNMLSQCRRIDKGLTMSVDIFASIAPGLR